MKVTIYGIGYVGLVTGVCLAEMGHTVCCLDIDTKKIQMLKEGQAPIYEDQLEDLLHKVQAAGRIHFTTDITEAVASETLSGMWHAIFTGTLIHSA